jgi:hypothetical protein
VDEVTRRQALKLASGIGVAALGVPAAVAAGQAGVDQTPGEPVAVESREALGLYLGKLDQPTRVRVLGLGQARIACGSTAPGEGWQRYGKNEQEAQLGTYIDIDTSEAKFKSVPVYITSLGGDSGGWEVKGASAIYPRLDKDDKPLPMETGFRVYLRYPDGAFEGMEECKKQWYLNWVAIGE